VPTILRWGGLRVVVYPNDHRPAHVHVVGGGGEAVFVLNCLAGPVSLRESFGLTGQSLRGIERMLNQALPRLCAAWETIHGDH
jgi:hypothetical protein